MTEVSITVHVTDPACLDAAVDALTDRGMLVHFRVRRRDEGRVFGSISLLLLPKLALVGGCRVERAAV